MEGGFETTGGGDWIVQVGPNNFIQRFKIDFYKPFKILVLLSLWIRSGILAAAAAMALERRLRERTVSLCFERGLLFPPVRTKTCFRSGCHRESTIYKGTLTSLNIRGYFNFFFCWSNFNKPFRSRLKDLFILKIF